MGLRFRRSFTLAPGIRMNFSGSGLSMSVGPRGLSATFGSRGTFLNAGIPGTGLYSRERIGPPSVSRSAPSSPGAITKSAIIRVEDDGTIKFLDENEQPLSQEWIERAKRQKGDLIRDLIRRSCDDINEKVEALGKIHLHTPAPHERIRYEPGKFEEPEPKRPAAKPHGFLGRLFRSVRDRIDAENAERAKAYEKAYSEWQAKEARFEENERARRSLLEERIFADVGAMENVLEGALQSIVWPRETKVSTEVDGGGLVVLLDVDLPEIEDMARKTASVPSKGYKLNVKDMSDTKIQKLYMQGDVPENVERMS